jgi:hypothetical protein
VVDSTFSHNRAAGGAGGSAAPGGDGVGGALDLVVSIATITDSIFNHNRALGGAGGTGASGGNGIGGALDVGSGVLFGIAETSSLTLGGSRLDHNHAVGGAGGEGGSGGNGWGGGIAVLAGKASVAGSTLNHNRAQGGEGGSGGNGGNGVGGGVYFASGTTPTRVNVLNSFAGIDSNHSFSGEPPDTQGAAGPSKYVETVNQAIAIYNKSTGTTVNSDSLSDFFFKQGGLTRVAGGSDAQGDSFITYDPLAQRFITGDLEFQVPSVDGGANALLLAVSKTNNLTTLTSADWYFYEVNTTEPGVALQDYPGNVGYNADALVITQNSIDANGNDLHTLVNALSISALTSGTPLTKGTNLFQTDISELLPRPATMTDATPGGPMWFVSTAGQGIQQGDPNTIDVLKMTNVLSASPTFTTTTLTVNPYFQAVPPLQPDGSAITANIDSRILNADEQNGLLVAAQSVSDAAGDEDNARWYEINVSSGTPVLQQEGDVSGGPGVYDTYPGIAINAQGVLGMSFIQSGTGSGQFMSEYVTGRLASDPAGTMEPPTLVQAGIGEANYAGFRGGDMSGINVDADGSFWVANEFANTETPLNWGTAIAHFVIQAVPLPLFLLSGSTLGHNEAVGGAGGEGGSGGNGWGGGLAVLAGKASVAGSTLNHNRAQGGEGEDGGNGGNGFGGGVYVASNASVTATGTTISHNRAEGGEGEDGGSDGRGVGGGVYHLGAFSFDVTTIIKKNHASTSNDNIGP